jgi:hypothetical protein
VDKFHRDMAESMATLLPRRVRPADLTGAFTGINPAVESQAGLLGGLDACNSPSRASLKPHLVSLAFDLFRHQVLMTLRPLPRCRGVKPRARFGRHDQGCSTPRHGVSSAILV